MNEMGSEELLELAEPKYNVKVSNHQLLAGSFIPPIDRLKIISPSEFEELVEEWLYGYLNKKYQKVIRVAGAGDKGRDVIAYEKYSKDGDETWDNYQCKHYDAPLTPSEMWVEFGKICYYTYKGDYSIPRKYYFVSPHGVGGKLFDFLMNPHTLKSELIKEWNKNCLKKITKVEEVRLEGEFKKFVENFDFSIFDVINPAELIAQYQQTVYFPFRFGGGLRKLPNRPSKAPDEIKQEELLYVRKLYDAYTNHKNKKIENISDLKQYRILMNHFNRQRTYFYQAESLKVFERDSIPEGVNAFEELKDQIYHGIIDTVYTEHKDGFERVKATTERAMNLVISSDNIFSDIVNGKDKNGICHHLANDGQYIDEEEIIWVIKDEE